MRYGTIFLVIPLTIGLYFCSGSQKETDQQNEPFVGTTQPTEKTSDTMGASVLTGVRSGDHAQYGRIVFEFHSVLPSYRVQYIARPFHQCGSGEEVAIQGAEILQVSFSVAQAHDEEGHATVGRISVPSSSSMEEVRLVCDFEGEVTYLIGMKGKIPYRVIELKEPARLVLDVKS